MSNALPTPAPRIDPETKAFWDATLEDTLLLKRCDDCGRVHWYPRIMCPWCGSFATSWIQSTGNGSVYSFTVVRRPQGEYVGAEPYVLALVELDEGPRVMTNIVDVDPASVEIGQPVEVVFQRASEDAALARFRPRR